LPASTTKKAVVRRFDREPLAGYINPFSFLQTAGVELMSADGKVSNIPYPDVKAVEFVRDFDLTEPGRRTFLTRPKTEGLWLRLGFRDGEILEGVMPNNLLHLEYQGFTVIPPESSSQQRVFVPRAALRSVEVLGVIGSPLKRRAKPASKDQIGLFD
jgi:hypothetical protein